MKTIAGENEFSALTIANLKVHVNAELNALIKSITQVVIVHHEGDHHNRFWQFMRNGETLKNKDEHKVMGMQFADKDCEHNDAMPLAFRKVDAHASDEVAELVQQARNEIFGVEFHDVFSCSV